MAEKKILTAEGLQKMQDELKDLKVNKRPEIAQKIKVAREQGDLSENAEYDAAKDEQGHIEARIAELEAILENAEAAPAGTVDKKKVGIGCKVTVHDEEYDEDLKFSIVGATEANSLKGMISIESPVGAALIGHKKNDVVSVETPAGTVNYKIVKIEHAK